MNSIVGNVKVVNVEGSSPSSFALLRVMRGAGRAVGGFGSRIGGVFGVGKSRGMDHLPPTAKEKDSASIQW